MPETRSGVVAGLGSWLGSVSGRDEAGWAGRWAVLLGRWSGGVVVFVDEITVDAAGPDPADGGRFRCGLVDGGGGALVDAAVGAVVVVVLEVLDEQLVELAFVPDQGAVEQFGSGGVHEAFSGGVDAGRSGWGVDHVEPVGIEDLVERGYEHGGVVSDQEPEPVDIECHGEVGGGLGAPVAGEMTGDASEVYASGGVFDEEQHVELSEPDGVNDEGVTSMDPAGLGGEELGPGRPGVPRSGIDAMPFQDRRDGRCCQAVAEAGGFAVDVPVAPRRVLGGEATTSCSRSRTVRGRPGRRCG